MRQGFPAVREGMAIGLLGGSFDPPHDGHVHISQAALKRFGLDHLWWLVSPGNPLKEHGPAPLGERMQASQAMMRHPRVTVTAIEARLGTRYTAQTIAALRRRYPGVRFVWIMGADNLAQFHRWQDWRWIIETVPVGVIARPGQRLGARRSKAAKVYRHARVMGRASHILGLLDAPAWSFINVPMSDQSSSAIRARGEW